MPAPPEIREARCQIRIVEIFIQPKPERTTDPNGNIGITGEIEVYLEGKRRNTQPTLSANQPSRITGKDLVRIMANMVGDQDLLAQTDDDTNQTRTKVLETYRPVAELILDVTVTNNRPRK